MSRGVTPQASGELYRMNSAAGSKAAHSPGKQQKTSCTRKASARCNSWCSLSTGTCSTGRYSVPNRW
eukprot:6351829-Alexandrium_andersonii.AAC.1